MNLSPVGAAPAYNASFCAVVLNDAALGHTLAATAARIGVSAEFNSRRPN